MAFTLRDTNSPGFTNKGSALTYSEGDNNFIGLYNRDNLRLALTGGTLTGGLDISSGNFDVASGQILSGGTDIATLWGGGGGGATDLNGLTDVSVLGTGLNWSLFKNGITPDGVPVTGTFSGNRNLAFGPNTLQAVTSGNDNVALGYRAGYSVTDGDDNFYVGWSPAFSNNGIRNIVIGRTALFTATDSDSCIALGTQALYSLNNGDGNIAIGNQMGFSVSTGTHNTLIGYGTASGTEVTTGKYNITIGHRVGVNDGTLDNQFVIGNGHSSGGYLMSGDFDNDDEAKLGINLGKAAGTDQPQAIMPTATLHVKGQGITKSTTSLLIVNSGGDSIGRLKDDGKYVAFGLNALGSITTGDLNVAIGWQAGSDLTTGANNTAVGNGALGGGTVNNSTGANGNVAMGYNSMAEVGGSPYDNVYVGQTSGWIGSGWRNVGIGALAMRGASNSNYSFFSVGIGYQSLTNVNNNSGAYTGSNTAIGTSSGKNVSSGLNNVFIGSGAGHNITTGDNNIFIGGATGGLDTSADPISGEVEGSDPLVSNELNIGNQIIGSMDSSDQYTKFVGQTYSELYDMGTITGAAVTPDLTNGNVQKATISGVCNASTFPANVKAGSTFILMLEQATGADTISAWNAGYKFPGGVAPTLSTSVGAIDVITCIAISSTEAVVTSSLDH